MLPLRQITPLLICVLCGSAVAGALPTHRLDAGPGEVRTIRAADLTGDGRADILAFTDGPDGIAIRIWCADAAGAFPNKKPDLVVVPKDMGLGAVYYAFPAVLEKGEPAALVLVDGERGVVRVTVVFAKEKWSLEGPEKVAEAPKLPFFPDDRRIAVLDAAADLNGDGDDELLLPTATGYAIVDPTPAAEPGGEKRPVRLLDTGTDHYLTSGAHRFLSLHWHIPRLTVADYDADEDGLQDLIASRGDRFQIHLQRKDGSFILESRRVDLLAPAPWAKESSTFVLGDVDGDRKVDLLVTQTPTSVKVMGDFSSQHSLFLNPHIFARRTEGRLSTPASTFRTGGTSFNPRLLDFDGDGDLDLLVSSLEIDLGSQIRKDVSAEYSLFKFERDNGEKGFDSSSHFDVTRTYPWERLQRGSTPTVCFFEGDFNGDGKKDLLDIADDGHLTILTGRTGGGLFASAYGFSEEEDGNPLFRAKAAVESDLIIRDLDGDGASDLLAYRGDKIYVIRGVKGGGK